MSKSKPVFCQQNFDWTIGWLPCLKTFFFPPLLRSEYTKLRAIWKWPTCMKSLLSNMDFSWEKKCFARNSVIDMTRHLQRLCINIWMCQRVHKCHVTTLAASNRLIDFPFRGEGLSLDLEVDLHVELCILNLESLFYHVKVTQVLKSVWKFKTLH